MVNERYQKELFEFEEAKRCKPRFGAVFQKADFAITLTAEKIVFIVIGIVMLMVILFAFGVEKGKSLAVARQSPVQAQLTAPSAAAEQVKTAAVSAVVTTKTGTPVGPKKAVTQPDISGKPYIVVAAAFLRRDFALKEASRLKINGFEASVYYSDPYYLVCAGSFANKDSAQKIINKVRQTHRDAYVRLK